MKQYHAEASKSKAKLGIPIYLATKNYTAVIIILMVELKKTYSHHEMMGSTWGYEVASNSKFLPQAKARQHVLQCNM